MPALRSLAGLSMMKRHVDNWLSVLLVYLNIKGSVTAKFRDGSTIDVSQKDWLPFYEKVYRKHLEANGFSYTSDNMVKTPDGLILMLPLGRYSFILDEIFLSHIYGKPDLTGKVVIDVGAAIADTAFFFKKCGAKVIYGYEPDEVRARIAEKNIELNGMGDNIVLYKKKATVEELHNLIAAINDPIFLKVDCEGCEYDIIPKLDMSKITDIVMEYHVNRNNPNAIIGKPEPLLQALAREGFSHIRHDKKAFIITASR